MAINSRFSILFFSLALSGCSAAFRIKQNLTDGQIVDPAVVRKPSLERTIGIFPKFEDYLEGYFLGGIVDPEGHALQGVAVHVTDENGNAMESFDVGVTDQDGLYKVHFSLPIRWNRVNFTGAVTVESPWKVSAPKPQFVIKYVGTAGILAYYAKPMWIPVKSTVPKLPEIKAPPPAPKQKSEDGFGDFDLGK